MVTWTIPRDLDTYCAFLTLSLETSVLYLAAYSILWCTSVLSSVSYMHTLMMEPRPAPQSHVLIGHSTHTYIGGSKSAKCKRRGYLLYMSVVIGFFFLSLYQILDKITIKKDSCRIHVMTMQPHWFQACDRHETALHGGNT